MSKKRQKRTKTRGGIPGRKSIESGEDPIIEAHVLFVAEQMALLKRRAQIIQAAKEDGFELSDRQIDRYIGEVRRRWRGEYDSIKEVKDKKIEALNCLKDICQQARKRQQYTEAGEPYPAPDGWLMRQIIMDILKIEGLLDLRDKTDDELDSILDDLSRERAQKES